MSSVGLIKRVSKVVAFINIFCFALLDIQSKMIYHSDNIENCRIRHPRSRNPVVKSAVFVAITPYPLQLSQRLH
jgi:hypothetical protein